MPYKPGAGSQKDSTNAAVDDVYYSNEVIISGVPVALYRQAGSKGSSGSVSVSAINWDPSALVSTAFYTITKSPPIKIAPAKQALADKVTEQYVANPTKYDNPQAGIAGVKRYFPGTPDDGKVDDVTASQIPSTAVSSDIPAFLAQCLSETSDKNTWRETGQKGNPSNPTITGIWGNLGFPTTGCWKSDQTAWCMGFVNFALKSCGYRYVQTASAKAIQANPSAWNATQVGLDEGEPGDIVLFNFSHVAFIYTATAGKYTFVGGNQTPKATAGQPKNNPDDGDVTIMYPNGWTSSFGNIVGIWRPSKS